MGTRPSLPLFLLFTLFFFFHLALCCPLMLFSCGKPESTTDFSSESCGRHLFRCSNLTLQLQFYGQGSWYPVYDIKYPEKTLVVRDTRLTEKLKSTDCDFLYSFTWPISNFSIQDLEPWILFNCKASSYNFSHDFFHGNYGYSYCGSYDLYYSEHPEKLNSQKKGNCSRTEAAVVEWLLQFEEVSQDVVDFSLKSVGFSRHGKLEPHCFGCLMRGGECGSVDAAVNSSCICHLPCSDKKPRAAMKIGIGVGAIIITLALSLIMFCIFKIWTWGSLHDDSSDQNVETFLTSHGPLAVRRYRYSEVKQMTASYSVKLGQGGYGTVYKGALQDGTLVAVKLLKDTKGTGEEFINEVASIGRTNHVNVVSLLGYCSERANRALIYEYMPNGSLEKFLFIDDPNTTTSLGWDQLHKIALGIARGLEYLHRGCNTRMVHFDIKPHNILLDEDFCPKISDFGLAKLYKPAESVLSTVCVRGTAGYIAPEVFSRNFGVVSSKSDVYSYGMMVLEMVGRRRNVNTHVQNTSELYFPHWIHEHLGDDCYRRACRVTVGSEEIARKMILVGLWCIQTNPSSRPSISKVVEMLEGSADNIEIPPKQYICPPEKSSHMSDIDSFPTMSGSL